LIRYFEREFFSCGVGSGREFTLLGGRGAGVIIDLFRCMPPARAPMTWVASIMKKAVSSGESARMTREQ